MIRTAFRALLATAVLAVLTGLVFPLAMTGIAQTVFKQKAGGSLVEQNGKVVGSALVGQSWVGPQWFYGRPSATAKPYDGSASSGSNLGPLSKALAGAIGDRVKTITALEGSYRPGLKASDIPVDLLTSSASGLDPDISPAAARFQAPRIAAERGMPLARVQALIDSHTAPKTLGILGEPRVNVLALNLALSSP